MANSLVSVQIIPKTPNGKDVIPFVDEAITLIHESGLPYQVNPLDTTIEGEMTEVLSLVERMNEKMVELGCHNVITQMKILYQPTGITLSTLTEKYR
ncbi:thiamine-binding protein [Mangrovibacillus cuniculi]|uniref:Thiamine-binding protein n=1 Tax=Mangrovibacillus cuniculi TaxID=2593652 RepID=A0A7S8C9N5_9BACI|nr:thiamine-binding protein [Mangrovibacillus cuniculi]QPC45944.1 thiamine-binding protein [Mangrovibacillus cuniculi]